MPMNGANLGDSSESAMITASLLVRLMRGMWFRDKLVYRGICATAGSILRRCRGQP
jgi:hypothetical protein